MHKEPLYQQLSIDRLPNHVANIYEAAIRITYESQGATQRMLLNQNIIRKLKQKKSLAALDRMERGLEDYYS